MVSPLLYKDVPVMGQTGINVQVGTNTKIGVSPSLFETSQVAKDRFGGQSLGFSLIRLVKTKFLYYDGFFLYLCKIYARPKVRYKCMSYFCNLNNKGIRSVGNSRFAHEAQRSSSRAFV